MWCQSGRRGWTFVFVDEAPDDLFEGDAAGGEVEAGEGALKLVAIRRGEEVEVAAWIPSRGTSVVLVHEQGLRVVQIAAGLVAVGRS